jgi:hypothetical protein
MVVTDICAYSSELVTAIPGYMFGIKSMRFTDKMQHPALYASDLRNKS